MKRNKRRSVFLVLFLLVTATPAALLASDSPSLPNEGHLSTCGVAHGFAAGAFLAATIAALTPGGQGAAAILAVSAGTLRIGISILC
jgi:peptidoglycan/LPS O-acetylase OafA/YrhL